MSGHSKWSNIKHQKQTADKVRGQLFTKLANMITLAAREGGGADSESNFRLRLAIEKAKQANMPRENIDRAITRALGKSGEHTNLMEVVYEGFAPGNVAILAEGVTDNPQRTAAAVKNTFSSHGGSLGGSGSVAYLFEKIGEIYIGKEMVQDQILAYILECEALDLEVTDDNYIIFTTPQNLHKVKTYLESKQIKILDSELSFRAKISVEINEKNRVEQIIHLLGALEELDDIHKTYTNAVFSKNL